MNSPEYRARDAEKKRRKRREARGLPPDAPIVWMTPEQRREKHRERARLAYRRKRGLPDDYVAGAKTPEERLERERSRKRAYAQKNADLIRQRRGRLTWDEYVAKRKEEAEAAKLARIRDRAIQAARRAEERERQCQTSMKSGNGKTPKSGSNLPGVTRKPGRILAMAGWLGW